MPTARRGSRFGPTIGRQVVGPEQLKGTVAGDGLNGGAGTALSVDAGAGLEISGGAVRIAAAAAGDGLTGGGGSALAVNPGSGLEISADAVAVTTAIRARLHCVRCPPADGAAGASCSAGSTRYLGFTGPASSLPTTEANAQERFLAARTVHGARVRISANAATAAGSATLRKNGADTAMTVAIGAGATGTFTLAGGPITYAAGDTFSLKFVTGTGGACTLGEVEFDIE